MRVRLKHRRLARELARGRRSQNGWALRLGLDSGHLSKLVNGQRPYPGAGTREKLIRGLGVSFDELFEVELTRSRKREKPTDPRTLPRGEAIMGYLEDLHFAGRMMRKSPGFTLLALLILALGVGANTALFSMVKGVLLGPLPFAEPDAIALVGSTRGTNGELGPVSYPDFLDWREQSRSFEKLAAFGEESFILGGREGAQRVAGEMVSVDYFELLGVAPELGRTFSAEEAASSSAERVVLIGHRLFQTGFGGDPAILGTSLRLNGEAFTVLGIMPEGFQGFAGNARLWVPMGLFDVVHPELVDYRILDNRGTRWHRVLGRLGDRVSFDRAQAELDRIASGLSEAHPRANADRGILVRSGREELVGDYRVSFMVLGGAVGFVLLIACANLATLFTGRALARSGEVAVRVALGASRARLVRQFLVETLVFALAGGALGFWLAHSTAPLLLALAPVELPSYVSPALDAGVLGFALLLSVLTGALFGILPAFTVAHSRPLEVMRTAGRSFEGRRSRFLLVVAEVSLAIVLLVSTGLTLKSLYRLQLFEPGFVAENLLTFRFHLPATKEGTDVPLERLVETLEALPGLETAAITSHVFFGQGYMSGDLTVEGYQGRSPQEEHISYRQYVGPGYFEAMGIPILRGRAFSKDDRADRPKVVVVDGALAERFWPGQDPIGKRLVFGKPGPDKPWMTVVGVAAMVRPRLRLGTGAVLEGGDAPAEPMAQVYAPMLQGGDWARAFVVRTKLDPLVMIEPIGQAIRELDPDIAVYSFASMEQLLANHRSDSRFLAFLMSLFAGLALLLAVVGIYGVVSYSVRELRQELGIRMALGAQRKSLLGLVMKRAVAISAVGLAIGLLAAGGLTRLLSSLLYEVTPLDLPTFLAVSLFAALAVLLASLLPARRAARTDPLTVLRHE